MEILVNHALDNMMRFFQELFGMKFLSGDDSALKLAELFFDLSVLLAFVAQAIGTWQSWQCYKEVVQGYEGVSQPGTWGDDSGGGLAGNRGNAGWQNWGGGRSGGDGGSPNQFEMEDNRPPREGRPAAGFQVFSGQGMRLGE